MVMCWASQRGEEERMENDGQYLVIIIIAT